MFPILLILKVFGQYLYFDSDNQIDLHFIFCAMPGDPDLKAYKYNQESTLKWLKIKVEKVAKKLEEKQCQLSGAQVSSYIKSSKSTLNSQGQCCLCRHVFCSCTYFCR
jgi:hypothetical protein